MASVRIALSNPKSPENVASVLRAAGNYGAEAIYYSGSRYPRALALGPDVPQLSRAVGRDIPIEYAECLVSAAAEGASIVCVEFALNAQPLPSFVHPENAHYIFGPEDGSIPQAIIDQADAVVYVPTTGCMNLAATVNVLLYDRLAKTSAMQSLNSDSNNQMIRNSRDQNNNLKVRK